MVTLRVEGVDWNNLCYFSRIAGKVTLRVEGVDWNYAYRDQAPLPGRCRSPSVWRVWIEIRRWKQNMAMDDRHPPCGGCGLKSAVTRKFLSWYRSPSVWRVWIEIFETSTGTYIKRSHPPCGGCGLKYTNPNYETKKIFCHPPCGGCGLKSFNRHRDHLSFQVTLRVEGVDWNYVDQRGI